MDMCRGVTSYQAVNGRFELRTGTPGPSPNLESWLKPVIPCVQNSIDIDNTIFIDDYSLQRRFPELKANRYLSPAGECTYHYPYEHLNNLFQFSQLSSTFDVLSAPAGCPDKQSDDILVIFGIKSMPGNREQRDAIRESWQDRRIWRDHGILMKTIFIIGQDKRFTIEPDEGVHDDILELDVIESHYSLSLKVGYIK